MVFVHAGVVTQTALHGTAHRAVLYPVAEVVQQAAIVTLGDDFHPHHTVGCKQDSAQLLVQPQVVGRATEEEIDSFQHGLFPD